MGIAHVQTVSGDWSSGSSFTASITATTGNLLAVSVHFLSINLGNDIASIGDTVNTYTQIDTSNDTFDGVNKRLTTYYAKNITGGSLTVTVTLTTDQVDRCRVYVTEISGAHLTTPLDVHTIQAQVDPGTGTDAVTSGGVTTAQGGEYVYGASFSYLNVTFTAGTGFTSNGANSNAAAERLIQGAAGSVAATFTINVASSSSRTHTAVATFKAAAAAASTPHRLMTLGVGM